MMRSVLNEGTGAGARARRLHARRRRQDRHDQRSARRLVRRLHARAADRGLGRLRRQPAARAERRAGGAADLDAVHEAGARRPRQRAVRRRPRASASSRSTATPASWPRPAARASSPKRSSPAPSRSQSCELHRVRRSSGLLHGRRRHGRFGRSAYNPEQMNQEVFAAVADALERGEAGGARDHRLDHRLDAAARRRQDAGLRRRPHGRHDRRRLLRERRVRKAREAITRRAAAAGPLRARRRLRAGNRAGLRRADGRLHRADRAVARALHHRRRPRRLPPGAAGARGRLPRARRRRPREVRQPRALSRRRRGRRRGHPGLARADADCRRTPTSSSSPAATPTTSTRCARWRRATCATSA